MFKQSDINMDNGPEKDICKKVLFHKKNKVPTGEDIEKRCKDVVELVKSYQEGIPLSKLAEFYSRVYGRPMRKKELGFSSIADFIDSLSQELYVENGQIYYKSAMAEASTPTDVVELVKDPPKAVPTKKNFKKVIKTVKKHPQGIPLDKLAEIFAQRYKQVLLPAELGFPSMETLVASLSKDLTLKNGVIFHKKNKVLTGEDFEKRCRDVVELVKSYQEGILLSKLAEFYNKAYGRSMKMKQLGFSSMADFIDSLSQELYVENGQIYYKSAMAEASTHTDVVELVKDPPKAVPTKDIFKKVIKTVKKHTQGIPLDKLAEIFAQRYKQVLLPAELGFPSMETLVASLSKDLTLKDGVIFHKKNKVLTGEDFEKRCKDVVELVKIYREGIPLSKLPTFYNKAYGRSMKMKQLGFSSIADFVDSLSQELYVENGQIYYRSAMAEASTPTVFSAPVHIDGVYNDVVELVKGNPRGIPLRLLSIFFSQEYQRNLKVSDLGFSSITSFIDSLSDELLVENERIFHKNHRRVPTPAIPPTVNYYPSPTNQSLKAGLLGDYYAQRDEYNRGIIIKNILALPSFMAVDCNQQIEAQKRASVHHKTEALLECENIVGRWRKPMSSSKVNSLAKDVMRALSAEGEHVTIERVISRVCSLLQVSTLKDLNVDALQHLPAVQDLQRTIKEINMYIESVEAVSCVCTLYELGKALANLKNKKCFKELNLGPLCKIPLIHRMFKIDPNTKDDDVRQISTVDILRSLKMFRRKSQTPRIDLADFLKHLADHYSCGSPYELGIRIQSLGLPISTLNKATASEYFLMDKARETIQREIQEEVDAKMFTIKKCLLDPTQGPAIYSQMGNSELRKKYANMTASDAVIEVFTNSEGVFSKAMTKNIQAFLLCIIRDRLARALFQLAICCGSLDAPEDLVAKEKTPKKAEAKKATEERATEMLPTEADVKSYFQDRVASFTSTPSLAQLRTLEKKIAEHFRFKDFSQLQQGTYLDFIIKNKKILQEAAGGAVSIDSQDPGANGFRPCRQDVFEFIKQCGEGDASRLAFIEAAVRSHYGIRDSRELGHGPLGCLVNYTQRQKDLIGDSAASVVRYECPLMPDGSGECVSDTVGLLGEVGRDQACVCLLSAPLLQDLQEWSQWELVFRPSLGPIKDFIDKHCGKTELLALEVSPGVLLRVTSDTSDKHFSESAQALDPVGTAGHLVSIVVSDGIPNTPTALLANHMESALNVAVAQEEITPGEDEYSCGGVARFVLECIAKMPTRICKELLQQVFLEPLSKVLGQAKSKALLLDAARSNTRHLNKLHQMGLLLGITEWRGDFNSKLVSPARPELKKV
ncbi:uncharacterized protein LOC143753264 isoform X1 [Siphateles boraxobius]|uniref:uncharacterized protein LOC143753264 isoform X1 n=2 Tax=Siphateles boraxobius TaxID=180520 RepID=UPI0040640FBD